MRLLAAALAALVLLSASAWGATASFATRSDDCALYGAGQPVFACSVAQTGTAIADPGDCILGGCVVRVAAAVDGHVQVPGLLGITGEVLFQEARDQICHATTATPADTLACTGDAVLFVPVAPGACADFTVASKVVEVLLSIVVSTNAQFRADTERGFQLCRDAAGQPSLA